MLEARIAPTLHKIIQNSHFKKNVSLEEQKAQKVDGHVRGRQIAFMIYDYFRFTGVHETVVESGRLVRGRQIAFMIYDYFRFTGVHETVVDYQNLLSVTLQEDNVQEFETRWDAVFMIFVKDPIRTTDIGASV